MWTGPRLLLFDVMGTVVDIDRSIQRRTGATLAAAGVDAGRVPQLIDEWGRVMQTAMDEIVAGAAPWRGHRELRAAALAQVWSSAGDLPELSGDAVTDLCGVVGRLEPWPDSPAALAELRRTCRVVALSNADQAELAELSAHGGLVWDAVLSAQTVRSYKPDPAVYRMGAEAMGVGPAQVLMVAAHPWDLRAAAAQGFSTAYVARPDAECPAADDAFDLEVADLAELAELMRQG
jgi:2-haloacid dehalogenase